MAVYFYYGEEDFNIESEINKLKSRLNKDFLSMNFVSLDNPDYQTLISALRTPPMMFGDMLVVINSDKYFLSNKNFFSDEELEDIEDALLNNPETLNIVFEVKLPRDENKKLDSRRKLFKILNKFEAKEFKAFKTYQIAEISKWVQSQAKTKGITITQDGMDLLIEQVGNNLRQYDLELEKLKLSAYPETSIKKSMVQEITISNQDLFNITELLMQDKKDKALLELKKLTDKKHPLEILSALQTMIRKWIILKLNSSKYSPTELGKMTGQHEYVVKQTLTKLKNTPVKDLIKLKTNLYNAECHIKMAEATDIISEVEIALIR